MDILASGIPVPVEQLVPCPPPHPISPSPSRKSMISELIIGTLTILASTAVMIAFVLVTIRLVRRAEANYTDRRPGIWQFFRLLSSAVILVLLANTVCVWLWAILFHFLGVFPTLEEAVYFSMVSFTTVGYGDVVVEHSWRILSGFVSVNGLLAFGVFTAVLIEIIRGLSDRYIPRR
mgnify:CR=1 FL=1|tara:strand:- start:1461 stop:1991 length:531 start_codon:yes stop_codon:yes gene_type:complete